MNKLDYYIDANILKKILNPEERNNLLEEIYEIFDNFNKNDLIELVFLEISDGKIPVLTINKPKSLDQLKKVYIMVGSQHNEYCGLFGQISYLYGLISTNNSEFLPKELEYSMMIFFPLMNPYGFLNPRPDNKFGYYLKNGDNLNRYWRKTFIPNYIEKDEDNNPYIIPENALVLKNFIQEYWERDLEIYLIDFHETSLLRRFTEDMVKNLNAFYKLEHYYKMWIVEYLVKREVLPKREPLFVKPHPDLDHHHFNITINQGEQLRENLKEAWEKNNDKLPFAYIYNYKSGDFCRSIARNVQSKLKDLMWDIRQPAFLHPEDHGCFVCLGHSTQRPKTFTFELECDKQFFNLLEEIEKCKSNQVYFNKKIDNINKTIEIVRETIKAVVNFNF